MPVAVRAETPPAASQAAIPRVAVLEFDARGGLSGDQASVLTDRLRAHLIQSGAYQVLERSQMQAILREQGFQQSAVACAEKDCAVELGRLLGVRYLISGSASRLDNLYVLNARLLDVEKGVIVREEYQDCECSLKDLLTRSTPALAQQLLRPGVSLAGPLPGGPALTVWTQTLNGPPWLGLGGWQDGPLAEARFHQPQALAALPDGAWLVADSGNQRLRRVQQGQVHTLAGTHWDWFKGEFWDAYADGAAEQARFHGLSAVAVDAKGVIYLADTEHHRIRRLTPDGMVSTWLGTGEAGLSDGPAAVARFHKPQGLACDADGNLYVADTDNHAIRVVSPEGRVRTLAGNGEGGLRDGVGAAARFRFPIGLSWDSAGRLLVADTYNHAVRQVRPDGSTSTLVGNGEAGFVEGSRGLARLNAPRGVAAGPHGQVWIADTDNHRIRVLSAEGQLQTLAGTGVAGWQDGNPAVGQFQRPQGLAYAQGTLWVADTGNHVLRVISGLPLSENQP
ncbi:MAG: CsgG/HfaB family protein [Candidatus Sericytochromatia bacterium]